ncbi:hypothetical protein MGN70_006540 [Eutypa lata]|nr:hypothetical protein MGN70_006540 [Eutypa lata]
MDDDPALQWPAWKFGMKRDELFTTLYDQYNTIPSAIQDNEAFHHDVYEISNVATNTDEFHRLLADRKEQRIRELNGTLESASLEIISNPSLIGTQQWQHAVQLFRTRSLDSLVRYFASYLPDDHPWHHSSNSTSYDDSHHEYSLTPARTLSFSEPETDLMTFSGTLSRDHDDEMSQSDDPDTPTTSISDFSETRSLPEYPSKDEVEDESITPAACDDAEEEVEEEGDAVSETPTPRNESSSDSYVNAKPSSSKHGPSPLYTHVLHEYARTSRKNRRDRSPGLSSRRRSPELGRVQKPLPDPIRSRPKGLVHMSRSHSRYP